MNKAVYGLLNNALLFYKKLVEDLEACVYKINPYNKCVANNMIKCKNMTVTWHVDDIKVSHQDAFEITKFLTNLSGIYGNKLTVHR